MIREMEYMKGIRHLDPQGRISIGRKFLEQMEFDPERDVFQIVVVNKNEFRVIRRSINMEDRIE